MRAASLVAAAATVLVANAFVLFHAQTNRSGSSDSELVLSERELTQIPMPNDDDSGIGLQMQWTSPFVRDEAGFLDGGKLRRLGFNLNQDAEQPRRVYAAIEYAGPAWAAFVAKRRESDTLGQLEPNRMSQLVPIDADLDPAPLRAKYPDRSKILVMPAVVSISGNTRNNARIQGRIFPANRDIHVPRPFADQIRKLGRNDSHFRIRLRFGKSFEPWVVGVEPL